VHPVAPTSTSAAGRYQAADLDPGAERPDIHPEHYGSFGQRQSHLVAFMVSILYEVEIPAKSIFTSNVAKV